MAKLVAENSYTDAELLALAREAYAKVVAGGKDIFFNGRRVTREDLATLLEQIQALEQRIAAAAASNQPKFTQARLNRP